jgi:hypothetical protein
MKTICQEIIGTCKKKNCTHCAIYHFQTKCDDGGAFEAVSSIQIAPHSGLSPPLSPHPPFLKIQIVCFFFF